MIKQLIAYFCLFLSSVFPINAGENNLNNNNINSELFEELMVAEQVSQPVVITVKNRLGMVETFHLFDDQLVLDLLLEIEKLWGIPVYKQRLIAGGRSLIEENSDKTFKYYGIQDEAVMFFTLKVEYLNR